MLLFPRKNSIAALFVACTVMGSVCAGEESGPETDPPAPAPGDQAENPEEPKPKPPSIEEINRLIDDLASENFKTRELAQLRLSEAVAGKEIQEIVRKRFLAAGDPEIRLRLRSTLDHVKRAEFFSRSKGFLGIQMQDAVMVGGKTGREMILSVMVLSVIPDSAAEEHGLEPGDHIMSVDGHGFSSVPSTEFKDRVSALNAGDEVTLRLRRGGAESVKKVPLGKRPPELDPISPASEDQYKLIFEDWLLHGGDMKPPKVTPSPYLPQP